MINEFTSTGFKLFRHPELIIMWQEGHPVPHSLQVALTEKCNLSCKFCSVRNREKKYEWDIEALKAATDIFIGLGTKTVEITGGGEPLCYPYIDSFVNFLKQRGMRIGLITNGIGINEHNLDLDWIRISANVFDYRGQIDIPVKHRETLGFSYVWTEGVSSVETLKKIHAIARVNRVDYIRIVPDCTKDIEKQNSFLRGVVKEIGYPMFLQEKNFNTPSDCYWGYLKPFLYADEYVYPCSSVVLNSNAEKQFHESYRICHWSMVKKLWSNSINSLVDTKKCDHCVFLQQNEILKYSLYPQQHENFI